MNKFTKAGLAGVAALTIAAGGGTYALWSDYVVNSGNSVGADQLKITLAQADASRFNKLDLAPGEKFDQENHITGRVGGTDIQKANAFITYTLTGQDDNGCGGTNAEQVVDPGCVNPGDSGELASQALVTVHRYNPDCSTGLANIVSDVPLAALSGVKTPLGTMTDGQQYCLKMTIELPEDATNAVMTDLASFDIKYDLEQIPNP
jgi:alternate signal-mediated exported protein